MPIVTFTTDFGTVDGYAGAMKGVVLSRAPGATLVEVTHDIPARDIDAGAFALAQAAPHFPPGTIHVAVVDPGVGGARAEIVVQAGGQIFVGPDNGLLALAAPAPRIVRRITNPAWRRERVSATFHGRDVFAVAAGRLAVGTPIDEAGERQADLVERRPGPAGAPRLGEDDAEILHVDAFGNLVTTYPAGAPAAGTWLLAAGEVVHGVTFARTYADVPVGAIVAYEGSAGLVEIAVRDGSAAARTGLARGARIHLRRPS
jgi:hypothetical protein